MQVCCSICLIASRTISFCSAAETHRSEKMEIIIYEPLLRLLKETSTYCFFVKYQMFQITDLPKGNAATCHCFDF